ncbi:MAG: hypothetical protein LUH03_07390 [Oscillospiraceae bacterium]|nr:hypothetical protein [Oscillospiraceae bacterium]
MTMVILLVAGGYLLFVILKEAHKEDATALATCILSVIPALLAFAGVYKFFTWLEDLITENLVLESYYLPLVIFVHIVGLLGSLAVLFFGAYFTMPFAMTAATTIKARANKGVEDKSKEVFGDEPKPHTLVEKANEVFSDDEKGG